MILARSAREEFEAARGESDSEMVMQLIMGGRQALRQVQEKVL